MRLKLFFLVVWVFLVALTCRANSLDDSQDSVLDEIIKQHWNGLPHKLESNSKTDKLPDPGLDAVEQILQQRQQNLSFQPIRFSVNFTLLGAADPRACTTAGQQVPMLSSQNQQIIYTCTAADIISPALAQIISANIMPTVTSFFSRLISVERVPVLQLDQTIFQQRNGECGPDVTIPPSFVNPGVPGADILIFVTARPSDTPNAVSDSLPCNYAQKSQNPPQFGRPLAATINFVPSAFQNLVAGVTAFEVRRAVRAAMREMVHVLGFDTIFYSSYIDRATGRPYTNPIVTSTPRSGTAPSGEAYTHIVRGLATPTVLAYARAHFACSALFAVELEDFNFNGTASRFWEKRVAGNELMTQVANPLSPLSGLTLSLLGDMGWYSVNFALAERLAWGRGLGCPFLSDRCEDNWPAFRGYWCDRQLIGCTPDREAKGVCNVVQYPDALDPYYQHFPSPNVGGQSPQADFCPFTQGVTFCLDESQTPDSNIGEVFGLASKCFEVGRGGRVDAANPTLACYPIRCTGNTLEVNVLGTFFTCPALGGTVDISSVIPTGVISCPSAAVLCGATENPNTPITSPTPPATAVPGPTVRIENEVDFIVERNKEARVNSAHSIQVASVLSLFALLLLFAGN